MIPLPPDLPASAPRPTWGQEPVVATSVTRSEIVLNGLWRFVPAVGPAEREPTDFGLAWVPGDWRKDHGDRPSVAFEGKSDAWKANRDELGKAWYERPLRIPADWKDRAILLDLRRIGTDAEVFIDGRSAGRVAWPSGQVDLTTFVRPGREHTLRLLVAATPEAKDVPVLMGVGQLSMVKADLHWRGVMDDVTLISRPLGAHVSDVFVRPSVREKSVTLDVELAGVAEDGTVNVTADMLDEKGRVETTFTTTANVQAKPLQTSRFTWKWPKPRLWDLDRPNLYTLRLRVDGAGLNDVYPQRFGFREFWISGRDFFLNGSKFRMRPTIGYEGGILTRSALEIKRLRARNHNIQEIWPNNDQQRGYTQFWAHHVAVADEMGWPLMGPSVHMDPLVSWWHEERWSDPTARAAWMATYEREMRRYRNSPSILLWANSGNNFGHNDDQDPRRIGTEFSDPVWKGENDRWTKHHRAGAEVYAVLRTLDPTRPILAHQGGPLSDVYTANTYLNFLPLQDREEWLSAWATKPGRKPFSAVEFGTPLNLSFLRGRENFPGASQSEPLITEYAAIYLGPSAYKTETPEYRRMIRDFFIEGQKYKWLSSEPIHQFAPNFQAVQRLFITNTWRAWRTWGISGGMVPWSAAHGFSTKPESPEISLGAFVPGQRGMYYPSIAGRDNPKGEIVHAAGRALTEGNAPTMAWIAGALPRWTEKGHHVAPGQTVRKSIALSNDERAPISYSVTWAAPGGGRTLTCDLAPGETRMLPISFRATRSGEITLKARLGTRDHTDRFPFTVVAPPSPASLAGVAVLDPEGATRRLLARLGITAKPWNGQNARLLIVGRKALPAPGPGLGAIQAFVKRGGRVLVMTQTPERLTQAGFRVSPHLTRRVFPVDAAHPVVKGLPADAFRDWAGATTLVDPYPKAESLLRPGNDNSPSYGWRWGSQGTVSSATVEKPHLSGWRPILEADFDLAYSPLMEMDFGAGRVTLSTLDLEEQAPVDPVAARTADRLIRYAATAPLRPQVPVAYMGGPSGLLKILGFSAPTTDRVPKSGLLIVGPDAKPKETEIKAFLSAGGRFSCLAPNRGGR